MKNSTQQTCDGETHHWRVTWTFVLFWAKVLSCRLLSGKFDQILFAGVQNNENHQWSFALVRYPSTITRFPLLHPGSESYIWRDAETERHHLHCLGTRWERSCSSSFFSSSPTLSNHDQYTHPPLQNTKIQLNLPLRPLKKTPFREMTQKTLFPFHFGSRLILSVGHI